MSSGHSICWKHLKRSCKCDSPKKMSMHHSFRVPPDGKTNEWKETLKWMMTINPYLKSQLDKVIIGTKLESYYNRLNRK